MAYAKVTYDRRHDKYMKNRNAAIYDAWMQILDMPGAGTYLAKRLGISRQRISKIVLSEQERRCNCCDV